MTEGGTRCDREEKHGVTVCDRGDNHVVTQEGEHGGIERRNTVLQRGGGNSL